MKEPITSGSAKQDGNIIEHSTDLVRYKHAFIEKESVMLEKSADEMDVSYFSQIRKEAYYEGVMIGMCESWCRIYKTAKAEKDAKMMSYMSPDIVKELERFYNKYGNLSDDKMSRRILRESEYLMGVWRD